MAARKKSANAASKREADLTEMVQSGPSGAYEALQLFRSRALRLKTKNDIAGSLKAAADGSVCLLENGYDNAGAELADIYVDLLIEVNQQMTEEIKNVILTIESKFPAKSNHRIELLKSCVKWSVSSGNRELGDPALHRRLADCLWDINSADKSAAYHFAAGEAPELLLAKIQATFPGGEAAARASREQALTLGLVHFLALENLRDANLLYSQYVKSQKAANSPVNSPLLTFCDYLLQTCRRDAAPLFKSLVNTYASTVDFDEQVPTLLMGPIASKFFGIKPKVNPMMSMLQSMMS
eukprot:gene7950-8770_t